jgi:hypothetical protein
MLTPPKVLNFDANAYISVTLDPSAASFGSPATLAAGHNAVEYVGPVGQLADVQLVSVPKDQWPAAQADVLGWLKSRPGVVHVEVQGPPRTRAKRGGDEL